MAAMLRGKEKTKKKYKQFIDGFYLQLVLMNQIILMMKMKKKKKKKRKIQS